MMIAMEMYLGVADDDDELHRRRAGRRIARAVYPEGRDHPLPPGRPFQDRKWRSYFHLFFPKPVTRTDSAHDAAVACGIRRALYIIIASGGWL